MVNFNHDHCCQTVRGQGLGQSCIYIACIAPSCCSLIKKWVNIIISHPIKLLVINKTGIIKLLIIH